MKHILTIQHTQSLHHINGMVGSWTDWEWTDEGKRQAHNIGIHLKSECGSTDFIIYLSDLLRAKQTAECIACHMGSELVLREELRERNVGSCCGKSVQWMRSHMEKQEKTVDDRMFSDAESHRDEWSRLKPFFDQVMADDHENIILVSHGDLLGIFFTMFLGLDVETLNGCEFLGRAGGVSQMLENEQKKRIIKRINDVSYIADC